MKEELDITKEAKGIKLSDIKKAVPKKKLNKAIDYFVEEVVSKNTNNLNVGELNFKTEGVLKDKIERDRKKV